jgi:hypothetical protein
VRTLGPSAALLACWVAACTPDDRGGCVDCEPPEWPAFVLHASVAHFTASATARNLGYADCDVEAEARLAAVEPPPGCPGCDQGYAGALDYAVETCSAQAGVAAPSTATFGMIAFGDDWEVWGLDLEGNWARVEVARLDEDGVRALQRVQTVWVDGPFGEIDAGQVGATLTFAPE